MMMVYDLIFIYIFKENSDAIQIPGRLKDSTEHSEPWAGVMWYPEFRRSTDGTNKNVAQRFNYLCFYTFGKSFYSDGEVAFFLCENKIQNVLR